jgi:hypothetical protein
MREKRSLYQLSLVCVSCVIHSSHADDTRHPCPCFSLIRRISHVSSSCMNYHSIIVLRSNWTRSIYSLSLLILKTHVFSSLSNVNFLPSTEPTAGYYANLIDTLVSKMSYERGKTLRGAPYDFRLSPCEYSDRVDDLHDFSRNHWQITLCDHPLWLSCNNVI